MRDLNLSDFDLLAQLLVRSFGGWLYIFSPSYRALKHAEWRHKGRRSAVYDVIAGLVGMALTLSLPLFVLLILLR